MYYCVRGATVTLINDTSRFTLIERAARYRVAFDDSDFRYNYDTHNYIFPYTLTATAHAAR